MGFPDLSIWLKRMLGSGSPDYDPPLATSEVGLFPDGNGNFVIVDSTGAVKRLYWQRKNELGNITGAVPLDVSKSNIFHGTLTGNVTFSFTNVPDDTDDFADFSLDIEQDGTGGWTITWPASVKFDSGIPVSLSTSADNYSSLGFRTLNGGATWICYRAADGVS